MNPNNTIQNWISKNGAASFNLKKQGILLHDGGLFSIEKEIKYHPKQKLIPCTRKGFENCSEFVEIPGTRERMEHYTATIWFQELDETIAYLQSMKRMLNKLGYKTRRIK